MASLTLCRFVRQASSLSRLVPRTNSLSLTCGRGFLPKIETVSPFSTCLRHPLRASTLSLHSGKALSKLPTAPLIQCRPASTAGDHVRLWQVERIVAAAFIVLLPACIILENAAVDVLFATLVVMHAHWGLEAVVVDYARPSVVGPILPKVAMASLYLLSAVTLVGLLALIYNGPGIGKTVNSMWSIGREPPAKSGSK